MSAADSTPVLSSPDRLDPGRAPPAAGIRPRSRAWAFAWLLVPVACHFGFSWIGFNPTDEGWLQAVARRLADGEVPHRDFIFVRPALSAWLQVPLVWWGGDHVLWLARLWGWLTLSAVCWIWSGRVARDSAPLLRFLLYVPALMLCANVFPVMAWHSIDGMLFATLAVALLDRDTPGRRRLAFFMAGLAVVCRQNFAVFAPLLLLAVGGRPMSWFVAGFWSALPLLLYFLGIAAAGGASDFVLQFWATHGAFRSVAIVRYGVEPWFWIGIGLGLVLMWALPRANRGTNALTRQMPGAVFVVISLLLALCLWRDPLHYATATQGLFGLVLGLAVPALVRGVSPPDRLTFVAAPALAWTTAISVGYNSPSLMSGILFLVAWQLLHLHQRTLAPARGPTPATTAGPRALFVLCAAAAVAAAFSRARQVFPYRDRPAGELRHDAGVALAGASGLRTNPVTFSTLADLRGLTERFESQRRRYAVLTDCAAVWIRSPSRNPLPCDWPQETELGYQPVLFARLFQGLSQMPADSRVIVQKFLISEYAQWTTPVPPDFSYYHAQNWVRTYCQKVEQTPYFDVYLPPPPGSVAPVTPSRAGAR